MKQNLLEVQPSFSLRGAWPRSAPACFLLKTIVFGRNETILKIRSSNTKLSIIISPPQKKIKCYLFDYTMTLRIKLSWVGGGRGGWGAGLSEIKAS